MREVGIVIRLCVGVAFCHLFCGVLRAQDWATLTVTVVDSSAALVPGAVVTLRDSSHGTVRQTTTREDGHATFDALAPGGYVLEVLKTGFNKYQIDQLMLNVRDRQTLRVELKVAAAAGTSIEVSTRAESLSSLLSLNCLY